MAEDSLERGGHFEVRDEDAVEGVEARQVSKMYPGTQALKDVTMSIRNGEIVALVGHNGAGKSTLTRVLAGVERPDSGEVHLDGSPVHFRSPDDAIAHGVVLVPQQLMVSPNLSVRDNLLLGMGVRERRQARQLVVPNQRFSEGRGDVRSNHPQEAVASLERVVGELGLSPYLRLRAGALRPGAARRLMIGRALLRNPSVIILDEPTANLPRPDVEKVFSMLQPLAARGIAILYISHRLHEVLELADRVLVIRHGRIVSEAETITLSKAGLAEAITGAAIAEKGPARGNVQRSQALTEIMRCDRLSRPPNIRDVSFVLHRGEILGLTGLIGSGRTSLLRLLWGAERASSGRVVVDGKPLPGATPRQAVEAGIAYVPEDRAGTAFVAEMSVADNVTLPALKNFVFGRLFPFISARRQQRAVNSILARLDVQPRSSARRKIKLLSGGNQQKAIIARWLLKGANVFLFDEPTEGIDIGARQEVYRLIRSLAEKGAGVVVSSSDIQEVVELSDRVAIMRNGELVDILDGERLSEPEVSHACLDVTGSA